MSEPSEMKSSEKFGIKFFQKPGSDAIGVSLTSHEQLNTFLSNLSEPNLLAAFRLIKSSDASVEYSFKKRGQYSWSLEIDEQRVLSRRHSSVIPHLFQGKKLQHQSFKYQKTGIRFLLKNPKCILADDMGLGKTIQCIGAIESFLFLNLGAKVAVFCPNALTTVWEQEFRNWCPMIVSRTISSSSITDLLQIIESANVVIIPYSIAGKVNHLLKKGNDEIFDVVVADEAHRLRTVHRKYTSLFLV